MSLLQILKFPDNRLRLKAKYVPIINDSIKTLAKDMLETMYQENGIGLAATQVNKQLRIVVLDTSEKRNQPLILINPKIIEKIGQFTSQEGCLSVPGIFAEVQRASEIRLQYSDIDSNQQVKLFSGINSVCIQHELDHLQGILFIDLLSADMQKKAKQLISNSHTESSAKSYKLEADSNQNVVALKIDNL